MRLSILTIRQLVGVPFRHVSLPPRRANRLMMAKKWEAGARSA